MLVNEFIDKCFFGDESDVKSLVERDPGLHNKQAGTRGQTGLMAALENRQHSLCRWLLSLPGLDTSLGNEYNHTALHYACTRDRPLDIVIALVRLSSWETVNIKDSDNKTALDRAIRKDNISAAIYLSWLGAECREENRNCYLTGYFPDRVKHTFTEVTLQTWIEADCQQEAQYWAVAANNIEALKTLRMENVTLDREKLKALAKQFNHQKICSVWGELASLETLAWEKVWQSSRTLTAPRPGTALPELNPDSYRDTINNESTISVSTPGRNSFSMHMKKVASKIISCKQ